MDRPQHFSEGNFMSYQNGVKAFIAATQVRLLVPLLFFSARPALPRDELDAYLQV